ncbi:hypothetical protein MLD38_001440 [Melastoma candidum]|uniref:Uncharacterized protein n=1 Tax=Melastoma candidum TaxID=119954 RepID=A0ACB9SF81_9MYRT|nr:hypothetical protein MLD38_001440 [Melastoma candidum]
MERHVDTTLLVLLLLFQKSTAPTTKGDVIAREVILGGTLRAFSNSSFHQLVQRLKEVIVEQASSVFQCKGEVDFFENESTIYPPTMSHERVYKHMRKVTIDLVSQDRFRVVPPMMGAEDLSFYSEDVPAAFFYVRMRNELLGSIHTGHSPHFMIE